MKLPHKSSSLIFLIGALNFILFTNPLRAIDIENFAGSQSVTASGQGDTQFSVVDNAGSLGMWRTFTAHVSNDGLTVGALTFSGLYGRQSFPLTSGWTRIDWDCNTSGASINYSGCGGIDLTIDGPSAFVFNDLSYEWSNQKPAYLIVTVYDSSDASGQRYSRGTLTLNTIYSDADLSLSFAAMTQSGPNGPASLANVGAISLQVDDLNANTDVDVSFRLFGTNGSCHALDQNGRPNCPTPTATATSTRTATPSRTPTRTATVTRTPTRTRTPTATASATRTPTRTATASNSPTITRTPTATATQTVTSTATRTATVTATPSLTRTPTSTATASATPTVTRTATPSHTPSLTATRTATSTATATSTFTTTRTAPPTPSVTNTGTPTRTASATNTATATRTSTATNTATVTLTVPPTPSVTNTHTPTRAATVTNTSTPTQTSTSTVAATNTASSTPTATSRATETATSLPSETPTTAPSSTATAEPTPSSLPSSTPTSQDTPPAQETPTAEPSPTIGTTCTSGLDVCGICGGSETDLNNCEPVPSNCSLVPPTKEMKKIASQIKKASDVIRKRYVADVKRARSIASCKSLLNEGASVRIKELLDQASSHVKNQILRSVQVCGDDCLTVSFEREVNNIRSLLSKASKESKILARKVVMCSPVRPSSSSQAGPRGDTELNDALRKTRSIVAKCKVCNH